MSISRVVEIPATPDSQPLGVSVLDNPESGVDLASWEYVEQEYLVTGAAPEWSYADSDTAVPSASQVPYTTRVLVRRPADPARFNGVLQSEPLHPEKDAALTWHALHPWIMRTGSAWAGITQDSTIASRIREDFDPVRYGELSIPAESLRYDIVGDAVSMLRTDTHGIWAGFPAIERAYLSGWSMTGTFCRVFLGDGFHARHRLADGSPTFDGYVIGISSGGAARAGYPPLSVGGEAPALDDPRRTIGPHDVPVIELLSELESETHENCLRPDSDRPDDRYRLYQVAGTSHDSRGPRETLTNAEQYRRRGLPVYAHEINEEPTDARMDFIARAVFALLDDWVRAGEAPPRAQRFAFAPSAADWERVPAAARPLVRDLHGNAVGGIRTPWVEAPVARYAPHSTPRPGSCQPPPDAPMASPEQVAAMIGHMCPFGADTLTGLYPSRAAYVSQFLESCNRLMQQGFLLSEEVGPLVEQARERDLDLR